MNSKKQLNRTNLTISLSMKNITIETLRFTFEAIAFRMFLSIVIKMDEIPNATKIGLLL